MECFLNTFFEIVNKICPCPKEEEITDRVNEVVFNRDEPLFSSFYIGEYNYA